MQAILRGGNEYGEAWHKAGMLGSKQNVFEQIARIASRNNIAAHVIVLVQIIGTIDLPANPWYIGKGGIPVIVV